MLCYKFSDKSVSICVGIGSRFFIVLLLSNLLWLLVIAKTHVLLLFTVVFV